MKIGDHPYPAVSLEHARNLAAELREEIALGIDPKAKKEEANKRLFEPLALEWWQDNKESWSADHAEKVKKWLVKDVFPQIGKLPVTEIDHGHIADIMLGIEKAGHPTCAAPILSVLNRIFGRALVRKFTTINPAQCFPLKDVIKPIPKVQHRAAITEPKQLGALLRDIENWKDGAYSTVQSLRLIPYIFLRPKEIRLMRWEYVDFDAGLIRLPDSEMKKDRDHLVPMARQVMQQLKEVQIMTGYSPYVFPSSRNSELPMSKNVITNALRVMGYGADVMCGHGFRSTASTLLHEQNWHHDVIETQLAHLTGSATSRAYNRSMHLAERTKMMQAWADYLDALRDGAEIIAIGRKA
ncbi:MAG: integrase [Zetaproteobacteria bacterium CG1_02_55_237]|nr:MAG: integrase [Zetaproteobacteria bacterium CG1_02_55_237]